MIIDYNLIKRVSRMDAKHLNKNVAVFHFDEESYNHNTICIPVDYLVSELREAINDIEPGCDIEWLKFLREYKISDLFNGVED